MASVYNIFEHLGIEERKGNKVTQHVKHYDEVPESRKGFPMYGQVKKDGVYTMLVLSYGRKPRMFNRTGKLMANCDDLAAQLSNMPSGVYIGELCCREFSLEVLSGIVNPNRTKPVEPGLLDEFRVSRFLWLFDRLSVSDFTEGESCIDWIDRFKSARVAAAHLPVDKPCGVLPFQMIHDEKGLEQFAKRHIGIGEEGAVFRPAGDAPGTGWVAGHKGFRCMKRVRRVEYDLLCTGVEEGTGKYSGKVANLLFKWGNGQEIKAMLGKGWTHEDAARMWNDTASAKGRIFQVYGLQDSSKGKIRLPKVGELRHDKDDPDY